MPHICRATFSLQMARFSQPAMSLSQGGLLESIGCWRLVLLPLHSSLLSSLPPLPSHLLYISASQSPVHLAHFFHLILVLLCVSFQALVCCPCPPGFLKLEKHYCYYYCLYVKQAK